jgi:pimeloyl-ACP methyl ester carboxylesterase
MKRRAFVVSAVASGVAMTSAGAACAQEDARMSTPAGNEMMETGVQSGYAPVNGLQMYYESRGSGGVPLVLLHGAFSNIETDFGKLIPLLAAKRRVIGVEQQGHGHTADLDRPLSYEQMADDTAALLEFLGIERADVLGYSIGGAVGLQLAVRHPNLVRKLVMAGGTSYRPDGLYPEVSAGAVDLTPDALAAALAGTPWQEAYARMAPHPDDWMALIAKKIAMDQRWQGWDPETIRAITAPALLVIGDSDIVRPEHTMELFRLFGGGVPGDLVGLPQSQLAVLPGTTHVTLVWNHPDWLAAMVEAFLDASVPET